MNQETYAVINDGAEFVALKTALRGLQFRIDRGHKVPKLTKCVTLVLCDKIPIVETCNDKDCSPKLLLTLDGIRQLRYLIDCDKIKLNTRDRKSVV